MKFNINKRAVLIFLSVLVALIVTATFTDLGVSKILADLDEGEYFITDLTGLNVIDANDGRVYGKLSEVINRGASDIYVVDTPNGERMIPAVPEFIDRIELETGIFVTPIEGMLD